MVEYSSVLNQLCRRPAWPCSPSADVEHYAAAGRRARSELALAQRRLEVALNIWCSLVRETEVELFSAVLLEQVELEALQFRSVQLSIRGEYPADPRDRSRRRLTGCD